MNIQELDILNILASEPFGNQRLLAERSGHSLGVVNRCLRSLAAEGYVDDAMQPTAKARALFAERRPKSAVILAAGTGMRMVPINLEVPKGLLEIHGEPLVERLICQLHEAGVNDIYIVVGFMKEQYEYLIDKYGVHLVVNTLFAQRNNLYSLSLAADKLSNTYVVPCDLWCSVNPFRPLELYSWYMVTDEDTAGSGFRVNRKRELVTDSPDGSCTLTGIAYLAEEQAAIVRERLRAMAANPRYNGAWWEETLYEKDCMLLPARIVPAAQAIEINTYEQLRELDSGSGQLRSDAIETAAGVLGASPSEIVDIEALKKGLTNNSFLFTCRGKRYIMRIPGAGSNELLDRHTEALVYEKIRPYGVCDNVLFIDPETGYKLTEYLENSRTADPKDPEDLRRCMEKFRAFHDLDLDLPKKFSIYDAIQDCEDQWNGTPSIYRDHETTKANVFSLRPYVDSIPVKKILCQIDTNADNMLFVKQPDGSEKVYIIDWEYAEAADPLLDIALFCSYSGLNKEECDMAIDAYFSDGCAPGMRLKMYCLFAFAALWASDWAECRIKSGVNLGEYALNQYRSTKEYYRMARKLMEEMNIQ